MKVVSLRVGRPERRSSRVRVVAARVAAERCVAGPDEARTELLATALAHCLFAELRAEPLMTVAAPTGCNRDRDDVGDRDRGGR